MVATLPDLIRQQRIEFIERERFAAPSFRAINDGQCDEFAVDLILRARKAGVPGEFVDLCNEQLMRGLDGDLDENDVWDWTLLTRHWNTAPPAGLSAEDVDGLEFGHHVWVFHEGRHYDAECPDGVENLFDLPIFRRTIVRALNERGISDEQVPGLEWDPSP
ncbi:hypothetical protein [Geopseudomonas aromaticivorans]